MNIDLEFEGQEVRRGGVGRFKASTALPGFQRPEFQCVPDKGPVPEGLYKVFIRDMGDARDDDRNRCNLSPAWGMQRIPRGDAAGDCEPFWANRGNNRARMEPADPQTRQACTIRRGGFYIHDSTKGYSHGCIEVDPGFFTVLKSGSLARTGGHLIIKVKYVAGRETNGGTYVAN